MSAAAPAYLRLTQPPLHRTAKIFPRVNRGKISQKHQPRNYGEGEEVVVVVVVLVPGAVLPVRLVSVLVAGAGDSFTIVVLLSVLFSAGGLVTVVSFCSHAASKAMLASK